MAAAGVDTELQPADDALLRSHGDLLAVLAEQHGLSDPSLGQDQGEIIVSVGKGRDGFDLAEYEIEVQNLLHARIAVTSARAPGAVSRGSLTTPDRS